MEIIDKIEQGGFSLINMEAVLGKTREVYPKWIAHSWTPRKERAVGNTIEEAVTALLEKLEM